MAIKYQLGNDTKRATLRHSATLGAWYVNCSCEVQEINRGFAMQRTSTLAILIISGAFFFLVASAGAQITPSEAKGYIGKRETVCGQVASTNFVARSKGRPTFLNLDRPYPNQVFTVVIWGNDRGKFGNAPETTYRGQKICVTGTVSSYRGVPQIVVSNPSQIGRGN